MSNSPKKRAFFAAFARLVGIVLGAAVGSYLGKIGFELSNPVMVVIFLVAAFLIMWFSEHERVS